MVTIERLNEDICFLPLLLKTELVLGHWLQNHHGMDRARSLSLATSASVNKLLTRMERKRGTPFRFGPIRGIRDVVQFTRAYKRANNLAFARAPMYGRFNPQHKEQRAALPER